VWLEITNLVIPGWTDDLEMIKKMCAWLAANGLHETPLHFSRFTPMYKLTQLPLTPVSTLEKARDIARAAGIRFVYIGNVPAHVAESTYCYNCGSLIIERRGFTILKNTLKEGTCGVCKAKVPGVWK
jgi:pyruvate formate lyase activating enzyme